MDSFASETGEIVNRPYGSTDATLTATGLYSPLPDEPSGPNEDIGDFVARGELGGSIIAAGGVGMLRAGGLVTATVTRGDSLTTTVVENDSEVAAAEPPLAPTTDWLDEVYAAADQAFADILTDLAALEAELDQWAVDTATSRNLVVADMAEAIADAIDAKAEFTADLAEAVADLDAAQTAVLTSMAELTADLADAFTEAATDNDTARTAAEQSAATARVQLAAKLASAVTTLNTARIQAGTSLAAELAAVQKSLNELKGSIEDQRDTDIAKRNADRNVHISGSNGDLGNLAQIGLTEAYLDYNVKQNID